MERLTSKSNEKVKLAVSIRDSSSRRIKHGLFFLEGARLCSDAAESGAEIVTAFVSESALKKYPFQSRAVLDVSSECFEISNELAERLSDTKNPQGIFCLCKIPQSFDSDALDYNGKYLLLENVQDPSNLGAVVRTAEALGISGVIVSGGCDIYNAKALRASMGSMLRLSVITCNDPAALLKTAESNGMLTLASTPDAEAEKINNVNLSAGVVCVVGNEGNGVTPETANACMKRVTIPMGGRAESLNASTAAAILIWEMMRR